MNHDGHLDLITASRDNQHSHIYYNDGQTNFTNKQAFGNPADTRSIAVIDLNKDGYPEIIKGNVVGGNVIYFGSKDRQYTRTIQFSSAKEETSSLAVADVDSDGDTDILVGNFNASNYIMLNKNAGQSFEQVKLSPQKYATYDIVVADLNKDSREDILVGNSDGLSFYYLNPFPKNKKAAENGEGR